MKLNLLEKQTDNQWRAERMRRWLQQHRSHSEEQKGKQSCKKAIEFEILNLGYWWPKKKYLMYS